MTDQEKRNKYKEILLNSYLNGVLKIIWSKSGFSLAVDSKRKELAVEIKEEDFVEYAFSIFKMVIDLAEGKEITEKYKGDLEAAGIILEKEYNLKNHLYIKRNSQIDGFKLLEYDIISHRNEKNPKDIEAASAILKFVIEKGEHDKAFSFEVSRRDLEDIIDGLLELREKMEMI